VVTTPRGTETVLLAEDDEIVRRLIVRVLKRSGYTVLVAEDGQQALDILEEKADEVAIAVLDVVMPKVSGRVVYERILEIAPACRSFSAAATAPTRSTPNSSPNGPASHAQTVTIPTIC
jgi:CheY-like chemotaxis protein